MFTTDAARIADYEARGWWAGTTVDAMFQQTAAAAPDALALIDPPNRPLLDGQPQERLTWAQVRDRVERMAAALLAAGLVKDDVICVQLPNTTDAVILFLAAARLGLIISPVVMQYREHELSHIFDLTTPKAFITVPTFHKHDHAAMAAGLLASRPGLRLLLLATSAEGTDREADLRAAMAAADPAPVAAHVAANPTAGGEVLTICWTSGTESRSKGVPRDHNHWVLNARIVAEAAGMRDGDVLLNPFPLVNIGSIGGQVMPWLLLRGRLVLHHPFDLPLFLAQAAAERVTYTIAPPAVLTALLKQPDLMRGTDLSALRAIGSGSAPLSPWLIEGWKEQHGIEICNIFGSNEGASLFSSPGDVPDPTERARYFPRFGAAGQDFDSIVHRVIRTRLADPDTGEEITVPGRPGELRITGAATFSGYWRSPHLTAAAFDDQGWYRTGDLFEIAGTGALSRFYRFVGRCKEIIVRGGVNISPAELDELLTGLPQAREAATVGIPDPDLGERVAVALVPRDGAEPTLADVLDWLKRADVAVFKRPERLVLLPVLPRNAMNKVQRDQLRAQVLAALDAA
ncbi:class I adenylate-forming enzyme family protein [Niveispirillum fermenti]|uniref:class I adenylate-forming enzyme family protein n=1 Tax=Niveispirillum fermenti TaxID=1233113 RepID=UPI003A8AB660